MIEHTHQWQDVSGARAERITFRQGDGGLPETLLSARWPGQKGINVSYHRFSGGAYISAIPGDHLVVIQPRPVMRIKCHIGDDRLDHPAAAWNVTICPANMPCGAESSGDLETLVLSVPAQSLAFALADRARPAARLVSCLDGQDDILSGLGQAIAREAAAGFPEGPLWWDGLTDEFIEQLVDHHLSSPSILARGLLSKQALLRVREFVAANIGQALTTSAMAAAAGQNRSHFARIFSRTVGMTPHRYVVQARLAHAIHLIRAKHLSLAQAATDAGFADQSHLANWARRIYGATLTQLVR